MGGWSRTRQFSYEQICRLLKNPGLSLPMKPLTLMTFEDYGKRFDTEELYLDSKSGAFQVEDSRLDEAKHLERLYLVAAVAILFSTL